ncbi:MAG: peptide deformylase [candidate division Zixibacteria bacterium]|nr:peptide deformylase [candidate division Zixibacteria bacterium]
MAERPIVIYGNPVLREKGSRVEEIDQETKDLVSDLMDTLRRARGLGLTAHQIGVAKNVFIVDFSAIDINETLRVFINPEIIETSDDLEEMEEGCLSFPDLYMKISRPRQVTVRATDIDGNRFEITAQGLAARAIQHEYDHTQGDLYIDHVSPLTRTMIKGRLKKLAAAS